MEQKKTILTYAGLKKLEDELHDLKVNKRREIAGKIKEAREQGDLSENAEYDAAREKQSFIEGRITVLESRIPALQVIDPKTLNAGSKIVFGATVTLADEDSDKEVTYQIVGVDEADIEHNKVSVSSPIARALIGKSEGDEVTVHAPKGDLTYEVVAVEYI
mgnify:CR=1 FL=1